MVDIEKYVMIDDIDVFQTRCSYIAVIWYENLSKAGHAAKRRWSSCGASACGTGAAAPAAARPAAKAASRDFSNVCNNLWQQPAQFGRIYHSIMSKEANE